MGTPRSTSWANCSSVNGVDGKTSFSNSMLSAHRLTQSGPWKSKRSVNPANVSRGGNSMSEKSDSSRSAEQLRRLPKKIDDFSIFDRKKGRFFDRIFLNLLIFWSNICELLKATIITLKISPLRIGWSINDYIVEGLLFLNLL